MSPLRALPAALLVAFGLTACGGGGSASADGPAPTTSSSGVLVDDRVADATVFCDSNGNGNLDEGEASVSTDANGAFTFSPACTAAVVSVAGTGYDLTLMKAPKAKFRAQAGSAVVSPFTTMWLDSGLTLDDFKAVLAKLGLAGIDPATFDPTLDGSRAGSAAAVMKILNDIADIVESTGGDPQAAFQAAVAGLVAKAQTTSVSNVFDDSGTALDDLVEEASKRAFATVDRSVWSDAAKANAAKIARDGISTLARTVHGRGSYDAAHDDLNNGSVKGIISETDLEDADRVTEARGRCRGGEARQPQYVYAKDDQFTIVGGDSVATAYSLAQFGTGIDLSGTTLGALKQLILPVQAKPLALPRHGDRIALALQVEQDDGSRLLQVALDRVTLRRDSSTGVVSASIGSNAKLYFYARSASGIEIGTGRNGFTDLDASLLTSTSSGIGLDLQALATKMKGKFPADTELLDKLLTAKGTFKVRLVVGELDLRHADATRFSVGRVAVKIPGETSSHRGAYRVNGTAVTGTLTF
jgi:hypothetical protein